MGCCGCTNKTTVTVGGILGLIQAAIGLVFNIYFLTIYYGFEKHADKFLNRGTAVLIAGTLNSVPLIRGLLIAATLLHISWIVSSILVIVGNRSDHVPLLRQWIVVTSLIIIADFLFAPILLGFTISDVKEAQDLLEGRILSESKNYQTRTILTEVSNDLWKYYFLLLASFCRLGLITFITNICLAVFTGRRVTEIIHPTAGYVLAPAPPGAVPVYPVMQPHVGYPMVQPVQNQSPEPKSYNSKI